MRRLGTASVVANAVQVLCRQLHAAAIPASVAAHIEGGGFSIAQVPGAGRGLLAWKLLPKGRVVLEEHPFLCVPSAENRDKVCYACLQVLDCNNSEEAGDEAAPQGQAQQPLAHAGRVFCSTPCLERAASRFWAAEQRMELEALEAACAAKGERFPLLAARLAAMQLQRAAIAPAGLPGSREGADAADPEGNLGDLRFLAFANVPSPPPQPWAEAHQHLQMAIQGYLASSSPHHTAAVHGQVKATATALNIDWFVKVMSRLHINSFRVDAVLPLTWMDLASAAAAAVTGDGSTSSGSAVYLTASLLNHSCDPNLDLGFPYNDGTVVLTAARDVMPGEQLTISYIDASMHVLRRQEHLAWNYGFACRCDRCTEDQHAINSKR